MKITKPRLSMLLIVLCLNWSISAMAEQGMNPAPEMMLEGISARQAVSLANQWRWTHKDITSYANTQEVVFKFPSGNVTRIKLPKNEVMVAVAPYIHNTHQ